MKPLDYLLPGRSGRKLFVLTVVEIDQVSGGQCHRTQDAFATPTPHIPTVHAIHQPVPAISLLGIDEFRYKPSEPVPVPEVKYF